MPQKWDKLSSGFFGCASRILFFVVFLLLTSVVYDGNLKQLADDASEFIYMWIGKLSSLFDRFLY